MIVSLGVALSLALPRIALAPLLFEALPDGRNGSVLFIRDCGLGGMPRDTACQSWQQHFSSAGRFPRLSGDSTYYRGDPAALDSALRSRSFSEVWLLSYGGDVQAGVEIGRLLRAASMTVRVASWQRVAAVSDWPRAKHEVACISSCTIAFMGGLFRYMDAGASYQVHSASSVSSTLQPYQIDLVKNEKFSELAGIIYGVSRGRALQLVTHFQNTLLRMAGRPQRPENDDLIFKWGRGIPRNPYSAERASHDIQRFRAEGAGSIQDLIMQLERDAMGWAIEDLRAELPQLGLRAQPALRMLQAMYDVSIKETASLTRETMLSMGYLTQELDPAPGVP